MLLIIQLYSGQLYLWSFDKSKILFMKGYWQVGGGDFSNFLEALAYFSTVHCIWSYPVPLSMTTAGSLPAILQLIQPLTHANSRKLQPGNEITHRQFAKWRMGGWWTGFVKVLKSVTPRRLKEKKWINFKTKPSV